MFIMQHSHIAEVQTTYYDVYNAARLYAVVEVQTAYYDV